MVIHGLANAAKCDEKNRVSWVKRNVGCYCWIYSLPTWYTKRRVLVEVAHLVVERRGQGSPQRGYDRAPLRGALPSDPLLSDVVGQELLRGCVVVHHGGTVFSEGVHDLGREGGRKHDNRGLTETGGVHISCEGMLLHQCGRACKR